MGVNNLTVFHTYFIHIIGNLKGLNKTLFLYLKNHTMISTEEFRKYAIKHQGISSLTTDQYISSIENMTPYIIEERPMNITQMDVFSRLMKDRIIFMGTGVDDNVQAASADENDFRDYIYTAGVTDDGIGTPLDEFISLQIKIVMQGTNSATPPRIKELRAIALVT